MTPGLTGRSGRPALILGCSGTLQWATSHNDSHLGGMSPALQVLGKCLMGIPLCGMVWVHVNLTLWGRDGKIQGSFWANCPGKRAESLAVAAHGQLPWDVEWHWTMWMGCSALVTSVVELVAAQRVTVCRLDHPQSPAWKGSARNDCRCRAGLGIQSEGPWGDEKCRAACGLFNIRSLAGISWHMCLLKGQDTISQLLHTFLWAWSKQWRSLTRGKQRNHSSAEVVPTNTLSCLD